MTAAATVNLDTLPWIDRQWATLFSDDTNHLIVLTLISFIVHEVVYYGRHLPYLIADYIPSWQKYKLQEDKHLTRDEYWKCLKGVLSAHYLVELPLMTLFHPTAQLFGMRVAEVPLPSWSRIAMESCLFLVIEDTYHYWAHRALHKGNLYKLIHKQHHEFAAPVGICAEYAHPLEVIILSMGTLLGPLIYTWATGDFHVFSMLVWSVIRTCQAVEAHSGYDFPWSINKFIPFWSGADHHDFHHQNFIGNYSTSFRWWDLIMGTEGSYRLVRAKQALAKAEREHSGMKKADSKMKVKEE
ncbi:C-4 methyl sterol oxidase [Catenaria anguillulae PL171]|uniref:C-4 methyl sterol oxidase n=1 Tax=Catenaria anguillulae PL171 TaxID=765915 RepID=A0A1Y2HNX5_9FUNG|nr:C-4 methyl sterol oxidase [Catenaria anguillulae PL171]